MVVDIRYHLASLVAVFFALGLGIVVGMSLSAGEPGTEMREQWMAAIERELEELRLERRAAADELERVIGERETYRAVAEELVASLVEDRLAGEAAAVVVLGRNPAALDRVGAILEQAGAAVVDRRAIGPEEAAAGSGYSYQPGEAPRRLVAVVDGPADIYRESLQRLAEESAARGGRVTVAVSDESGWQTLLDELDLPYVTGWDSPLGLLSLVLLVSSSGEQGRYAAGAIPAAWPKHLLSIPVTPAAKGGGS